MSLAYGALLISALFAALQLQRHANTQPDGPKATLQATALSALFLAIWSLSELISRSDSIAGTDIATLQRLLSNLAYFVALPFFATALLISARHSHWERPAWGRWLIGLFALFELLRRMQHGELYTQIVAVAVPAAMLLAVWSQSRAQLRGTTLLATANMAIALLLMGPGALLTNPLFDHPFLYPLFLAATLPLSAIAIKQSVR
ncbi:hypothetical protein EH243_16120 [Amphritea opalescens]|uniref:Histidine kinase N-terminal 7TM region domain-containing protein n=1 Tax=Amphritea opalescens TaxID=2490544 RepID=A0A430KMD4_9GAMM|nr:hypothetical protein [Amphritea opalescens]RTE64630.1 hypothetical protein EH243_16120 [Amphritea opalescens]